MTKVLQQICQRKVYNFSLQHGKTLDEECKFIIEQLQQNDLTFQEQSYTLIGFSTGCLVVMRISEIIQVSQVILVNSAELLTRMNLKILESIVSPTQYASVQNI